MKTFSGTRVSDLQVKRLLRRRDGSEYFSDHGWTRDPYQAISFSTVLEAAETCIQRDLHEVDLTLCFAPGGCEVFSTELA